jgi:5-methylcytosine-specific restriction endonuclease McrA
MWTGFIWDTEQGWQRVAECGSRSEALERLGDRAREAGVTRSSHTALTLMGRRPTWSPGARPSPIASGPAEQPAEQPATVTASCPYCKAAIPAGALAFDHRVPTFRGGPHTIHNLVVCCQVCKEQKGPLSDNELRGLLALIRDFHPRAHQDILARLRSGGARCARGHKPKGPTP